MSLSNTVSVFADGSVKVAPFVVAPSRPLYAVPHDRTRISYDRGDWRYNGAKNGLARQVARDNNKPYPEVYRLDPGHSFRIPDSFVDLCAAKNPHLSSEMVESLFGRGLAFCNTNNFVFDQPRICGGATVTGVSSDGKLWLNTLRVDKPIPSGALDDPTLWFYCVGVRPDGLINYWWRTGTDGQKYKVQMFLVSAQPVYIPLDELKAVTTPPEAHELI